MTEATAPEATPETTAPVEATALGAIAAEGTGEPEAADPASAETEADPAETAEEEAPSVVGAPEEYDFTSMELPEGQEFDTELADMFKPVLKDMDLSQDAANKLLKTFAEQAAPALAQRQADAQMEVLEEIKADLSRQLQADPEVGGKKYEESKAMAARALNTFIPNAAERTEFSTFMNETGMGNHPMWMRVMAGAGRVLAEATTAPGGVSAAGKTEAEKFYGKRG
jgi:hypothetical protein